MRVDYYTKAVLTVIAVCLVILAATNWQGPNDAHADDPMPVVIVGVKSLGASWDDIPVKAIPGRPVPVDVKDGQVTVDGEVDCN